MKATKLFFAAVIAGTVLFSCKNEKDPSMAPACYSEFKLSIEAEKGSDTKAAILSADGRSLVSTWEQGDLVAVCRIDPDNGGLSKIIGVLAPASYGSSSTVLEGSVQLDGLSTGDRLYLQYPYKYTVDEATGDLWLESNYLGQDGDLNTVSSSYAYASCAIEITGLDGDDLSATKARFLNRQAIVKFSLTNGGLPLEAYKLRLFSPDLSYGFWGDIYYSHNGGLDVVSSMAPRSDFTVALRNCYPATAQPYTLYAVNSSNVYTAVTQPLQFADGSYNRGTGNLYTLSYSGFDTDSDWTIIGAIEGYSMVWDGDLNMWTNGNGFHVAASVNFSAGDQFKLRKGHAWDFNYGGSSISETSVAANGASVIPLSSTDAVGVDRDGYNFMMAADGIYDIYFDENTLSVIVVPASGAGKVSTTDVTPSVPSFTGWSLIGSINNTAWDTDFDLMNTEGDSWLIQGVTITDTDQFKLRKDHSWDYSLGGASSNLTIADGYEVFQPVVGTEFQSASNLAINIYIGVTGVYDIRLDAAKETILITESVDTYTVVGESETDLSSIDKLFTIQWDTKAFGNDMRDDDGDGVYEWETKVSELSSPIPVQFKIVRNHDWSSGYWPADSSNCTFTIQSTGTFHITFSTVSDEIKFWMDYD